jgi:sugar phosphate isomerase/epimerase
MPTAVSIDRRRFLALAAPLAIDPVKRPGPTADVKLSLAAYSFRKALDLKAPTMDLFGFLDLAAGLPLDAVELTSYYFADTSDAYLDRLKAHAAAKKLAVSGVPIRSTLTHRDGGKLAAEVAQVNTWTTRAARLGAKTVRIFAGNMETGDDPAACLKRTVGAIEACGDHAAKLGVLLALENHHGTTGTAEQLLAIVRAVQSPAFGVNLDTGNFRTADPYADLAKAAPYAVVAQLKTEVFPDGKKQPADLPRLVKLLKDANFHGYAALEHEADEDPREAVPRYVRQLRQLIG